MAPPPKRLVAWGVDDQQARQLQIELPALAQLLGPHLNGACRVQTDQVAWHQSACTSSKMRPLHLVVKLKGPTGLAKDTHGSLPPHQSPCRPPALQQTQHHSMLALTCRDIGGTNLLRDAACLAVLHVGAPDVVQNLGLACT